jgi:hypothetical protein
MIMPEGLHTFLLRLASLFRKRKLDREMAEEIEFHQAMLRDKALCQGFRVQKRPSRPARHSAMRGAGRNGCASFGNSAPLRIFSVMSLFHFVYCASRLGLHSLRC